MSIAKSTIAQNAFTAFYNLINDNITNPHGSKWVFSEEPDRQFYKHTDYPIIIISPIEEGEWEDMTMTKTKVPLEVKIEIQSTMWEKADVYFDQIKDLVETNKATLRASDDLKNIKQRDTDTDTFERGKIKVHWRNVRFTMDYTYDKTRSY